MCRLRVVFSLSLSLFFLSKNRGFAFWMCSFFIGTRYPPFLFCIHHHVDWPVKVCIRLILSLSTLCMFFRPTQPLLIQKSDRQAVLFLSLPQLFTDNRTQPNNNVQVNKVRTFCRLCLSLSLSLVVCVSESNTEHEPLSPSLSIYLCVSLCGSSLIALRRRKKNNSQKSQKFTLI